MESFLFGLLLLVVVSIFVIAGFALRWLRRRGRIGQCALGLAALGVGWALFEAIYPSDAVYIAELNRLSGVRLPDDASFLEKTASFPDLHGDYSACFIVRLTAAEMTAFEAALGTAFEPTVSEGTEVGRCDSVSRLMMTKSKVRNIDLSRRATRPDATIRAQVAEGNGLVKIEWDLW
jgi:hypothetical protein